MNIQKIIDNVSDLAVRKSGIAADQSLLVVASEHGDDHARQIMTQLQPEVMARIVREHDVTKESILGYLATPRDVAAMMDADPATWHNLGQATHEEIYALMRDVSDVVTGVILSHVEDEVWITETFEAIAESESALMYLIAPMVACGARQTMAFRVKSLRFPSPHNEDGQIGHIFRLAQTYAPDVCEQIIEIVADHAAEAALRGRDGEVFDGEGNRRLPFVFQEALGILFQLQAEKSVTDLTTVDQMFEPL